MIGRGWVIYANDEPVMLGMAETQEAAEQGARIALLGQDVVIEARSAMDEAPEVVMTLAAVNGLAILNSLHGMVATLFQAMTAGNARGFLHKA